MANSSFFRGAYAKSVFAFVRVGFAATGLLFAVLTAMAFSDAILKTRFGYQLSDGVWGCVGVAVTALGWLFVGAIERSLAGRFRSRVEAPTPPTSTPPHPAQPVPPSAPRSGCQ